MTACIGSVTLPFRSVLGFLLKQESLLANHSLLGTLKELIILTNRQSIRDIDEPFLQARPALEVSFYHLHGFLRERHTSVIGGLHQFDHRMLTFPGHPLGKLENSTHRINEGRVPVLDYKSP